MFYSEYIKPYNSQIISETEENKFILIKFKEKFFSFRSKQHDIKLPSPFSQAHGKLIIFEAVCVWKAIYIFVRQKIPVKNKLKLVENKDKKFKNPFRISMNEKKGYHYL